MEDKIKIRKAELRDVKIIAEFNARVAKETEHKVLDPDVALQGAKAILKDPHKGFYLVAEIKGEIVGQLMVTNEWSDWRNKLILWIQSVYVKEEHRKQGVFKALFHYLHDIARYKKNVAGLRLYVEKSNDVAHKVYEELEMTIPPYDMYELMF
ncbi:MAG: GNAT family N-acetyltransferase [Acidobacteria bacterium]|jgi:GNAT superfamily N-acetyltransferase|nr:GNAT family N-acetyltransferase [Acidobacteriota bacterium]